MTAVKTAEKSNQPLKSVQMPALPLQASNLEWLVTLLSASVSVSESGAHHTRPGRTGKPHHRVQCHLEFDKWQLSVFIIVR